MLYPRIIQRIVNRMKTSYEDLLILKEGTKYYKGYESWLSEYFDLTEKDTENIVKKFERSQTTSIINAMRRGDREIFINQLGVFFIKATTIDYYNSLNRLIDNRDPNEYNINEIRQVALNECKEAFIERANYKKHANDTKYIDIKTKTCS